VLFAAIMPPGHPLSNHVILYDQLYIKNCDSNKFAELFREKTQGHNFQAFIIDYRGGRVRSADTGETIEVQYGKALETYDVKSITTGHGFCWGSDDVEAGLQKFRSWLNKTKDAPPRILVFQDRLPDFEYEVQRYHYKRTKDGLTDVPNQTNNHLMDCCRYLAMYDPQWSEPKNPRSKYNPAEIVKAKKKKLRQQQGRGYISLGGG
jgi:hypothetical protein